MEKAEQSPSFPPVILDIGSGSIKAGTSLSSNPSLIMPTMVGIPKHQKILHDHEEPEYYVSTQLKKGLVKLCNAIDRGEVQNWDYMDSLLSHVFDTLQTSYIHEEGSALTLLMQPCVPVKERQLFAELLFEEYQTKKLLFSSTSIATLFGVGNYAGVVLDSGDTLTSCLAYINGIPLEKSLFSLPLGGRDVTMELCKLLRLSGFIFDTSSQVDFVKTIKETKCRVQSLKDSAAVHITRPIGLRMGKQRDQYAQEKLYLPDGTFIAYDEEWGKCFDIYFSSEYTKQMSLQDMLHYSLQSTDPSIRRALATSVIVTGGGTAGQGFVKRLGEEYDAMMGQPTKLLPGDKVECRFKEFPGKNTAAWAGGALLASTATAEKLCISKQEYEEKGVSVAAEKYLL